MQPNTHRQNATGYALLLMMFFLALMVISMTAVAPNVFTTARREKEQEMIWRGRQYVRGVRLYYQKTHRLPSRLDDLYLPKTGIRFMRQAYKDPMNAADGSWRLIYVGPNGQIIGSLNPHQNMFYFGAPAGTSLAGALGTSNASAINNANSGITNASPSSNAPFPDLSRTNELGSIPVNNGFGNGPSLPNIPTDTMQNANPMQPQAIQAQAPFSTISASPSGDINNDQTFGQTIIIGVGSKINKSSIQKLEGATNYLQFEFIWNGNNAQFGTVSR